MVWDFIDANIMHIILLTLHNHLETSDLLSAAEHNITRCTIHRYQSISRRLSHNNLIPFVGNYFET